MAFQSQPALAGTVALLVKGWMRPEASARPVNILMEPSPNRYIMPMSLRRSPLKSPVTSFIDARSQLLAGTVYPTVKSPKPPSALASEL